VAADGSRLLEKVELHALLAQRGPSRAGLPDDDHVRLLRKGRRNDVRKLLVGEARPDGAEVDYLGMRLLELVRHIIVHLVGIHYVRAEKIERFYGLGKHAPEHGFRRRVLDGDREESILVVMDAVRDRGARTGDQRDV